MEHVAGQGHLISASLTQKAECNSTEYISRAFAASPRSRVYEFPLEAGALITSRPGDSSLWAPLHDSRSKAYFVVLGRPVFDLQERRKLDCSASSSDQGRLSIELLRRFRDRGIRCFDSLHGSFVVLYLDLAAKRLTLRTDKTGVLPVFINSDSRERRLELCTNVDLLAKHSRSCELDMVSLAEHVRCGRIVHPYTHYASIRELEHASVYEFDLVSGRASHQRYWSPSFNVCSDKHVLVEDLSRAIQRAIWRRTDAREDGKIGVFLSGGADSRNVVFASTDRAKLNAVTLCDEENNEVRISRLLAARGGVSHRVINRDLEYYPRNAPRVLSLSSGMWNFVDGHFVGVEQELAGMGITKIITGCYADFLLKGIALNRSKVRLGQWLLPIYRREPFSLVHAYLWLIPVSQRWLVPIQERLSEELGGVEQQPDGEMSRLEIEARRVFPLSRGPSSAGRSSLSRLFPWEPVFIDNEILDVYQRIPASSKLNARVYFDAVDHVCREAADIPNANDNLPLSAGPFRKILNSLTPTFPIGCRNSQLLSNAVATNGSWPDWGKLMQHSDILRATWSSFGGEERELAGEILDFDPWKKPLADWRSEREVELFCRLYSVLLWHKGLNSIG